MSNASVNEELTSWEEMEEAVRKHHGAINSGLDEWSSPDYRVTASPRPLLRYLQPRFERLLAALAEARAGQAAAEERFIGYHGLKFAAMGYIETYGLVAGLSAFAQIVQELHAPPGGGEEEGE